MLSSLNIELYQLKKRWKLSCVYILHGYHEWVQLKSSTLFMAICVIEHISILVCLWHLCSALLLGEPSNHGCCH